jgi:uncharacterized membrane protein YjgN (DUF898 family)
MALKPFADVALARYRIDRISIGDAAARCNAHAVAVYGTYSTAWGVAFVATVCWIALILNVFPAAVRTLTIALGELANRTQIDPTANFLKVALIAALVAVGAVAYLLLVLVWALCFVAYRAALIRHIAATTEVAGLRFVLTFRTMQLLRLVIGNVFITVFTLGLGAPIVLDRNARFLARHLELRGTPDGAMIGQTRDRGPKRGEGLIDLLDLGAV